MIRLTTTHQKWQQIRAYLLMQISDAQKLIGPDYNFDGAVKMLSEKLAGELRDARSIQSNVTISFGNPSHADDIMDIARTLGIDAQITKA